MNFVADTLLPLNHRYLMTVFFAVSDDASGTVGIDTELRLVNFGDVPIKPSARLAIHDFLGTKIGEAELQADSAAEGNATMLLPDEMRLYRMRVPLEAGASPAWFAMRWEAY